MHPSPIPSSHPADYSRAVVNLIHEESPSCHVQCLRFPIIPNMIALLNGVLVEKHPNQAIVDVAGVGYDVTIPVSTYSSLPDAGASVRLRIYTHVREDALALYGFLKEDEKALFEKLISVSGIGP